MSTASIRSRMQTFAECTPVLGAECIVWVLSLESRVRCTQTGASTHCVGQELDN